MKIEKLSNLCHMQMGKTPSRSVPKYWGVGYPWVSIADLKQKRICKTKEQITHEAIEETNCKLIPKNTLLMSFKLSIGKLAFTDCDLYTNEAIVALSVIEKKKLDKNYLYYALQNVPLLKGTKKAVKGNTLNKSSIGRIKIPLPESLDDQIKIANLLSQVESLIAKREESIKLLDELLKSTFLDMFGDPVNNPFNWEEKFLSDLCLNNGEYGSGASAIDYDSSLPRYLRITDINSDGTLKEDKKSPSINEPKYYLEFGDLLFSRSGATVGKTYLHTSEEHLQFAGYLIRFKPNFDLINPYYLLYFTKSDYYNYWVLNKQRAAGQPNINAKEYSSLRLLKPPKPFQDKFATIVGKVEQTKKEYQKSLNELKNLFGSLSQRAFNGRLDLSKMEIEKQIVSIKINGKKFDLKEKKTFPIDARYKEKLASFSSLTKLQRTWRDSIYENQHSFSNSWKLEQEKFSTLAKLGKYNENICDFTKRHKAFFNPPLSVSNLSIDTMSDYLKNIRLATIDNLIEEQGLGAVTKALQFQQPYRTATEQISALASLNKWGEPYEKLLSQYRDKIEETKEVIESIANLSKLIEDELFDELYVKRDYHTIKEFVFKLIDSGKLKQEFNGKKIVLKKVEN